MFLRTIVTYLKVAPTFNNMNHPLLFCQIRFSDDHVAPIDRFRFMSCQLHALLPRTPLAPPLPPSYNWPRYEASRLGPPLREIVG